MLPHAVASSPSTAPINPSVGKQSFSARGALDHAQPLSEQSIQNRQRQLHRCTCISAFTRSHARPICWIAPRTPTQYGLWPQGSDRSEGSRLRQPSARVSGHPLIRTTKLKTLYFQGFILKGESKWLLARKRSSTGSQHSALLN